MDITPAEFEKRFPIGTEVKLCELDEAYQRQYPTVAPLMVPNFGGARTLKVSSNPTKNSGLTDDYSVQLSDGYYYNIRWIKSATTIKLEPVAAESKVKLEKHDDLSTSKVIALSVFGAFAAAAIKRARKNSAAKAANQKAEVVEQLSKGAK